MFDPNAHKYHGKASIDVKPLLQPGTTSLPNIRFNVTNYPPLETPPLVSVAPQPTKETTPDTRKAVCINRKLISEFLKPRTARGTLAPTTEQVETKINRAPSRSGSKKSKNTKVKEEPQSLFEEGGNNENLQF